MTQNELILVLGVNGLISFTMLVIGIVSYVRVRSFLSKAVETRGTVTASEYKGQADDGGGSMYSPKIKFTDRMGREYEFTENWSSNRPDFKLGDEVIVLYDPANPQKARRGGKKWKFYFITWLLGGLGLLFSGILLIVVIVLAIVGFPSK
jgi:hypothetical protein